MNKTIRPYSLLEPAKQNQYGPRSDWRLASTWDYWNPERVVDKIEGPVIVDFETTGLDVLAPDFRAVGIAIAGKGLEGGVYFSLKKAFDPMPLLQALLKRELVAHNVCYDAAVFEVLWFKNGGSTTLSSLWPWKWDTLSMYFHLSQHEWERQSYSLKAAQVDVLGWQDKGDVELVEWLETRGLDKKEMWRAGDDILGKYGCYDVQSTYQLYSHLLPQLQKFPDAVTFISEVEVPYHYRSIVEMRFYGIQIDTQKLASLKQELTENIESFRSEFINNEHVKPWLDEINQRKRAELGLAEPPKFTKSGKVTARWQKWEDKVYGFQPNEWLNINSKAQLRDLFFNNLYTTSEVQPVLGFDGTQKKFKGGKLVWKVEINNPYLEKPIVHEWAAKTQDIPVSKDLLPKLGPVGTMLFNYNADVKLLGYVVGLEESLKDGIHHGQLRPLGTLSGRCAGSGGVNLQQISKDPRYLQCFVARQNHTLIDADVTALEPCVLAELSECPNYMKLYGPNAKPNDIYLFVGGNTTALGATLRQYGYDPDNPTEEAIAETKKKLKKERGIAKVLHLSSGYGAGAGKIWKTLLSQGVELSFEEARQIHSDYWQLFKRVKAFEEELKETRVNNGGWIVDGLGLPITIGKHKLKDILNTLIQGTGHRILVRHIANVMKLRDKKKVPFGIWIADFHDELITECQDSVVDEVLTIFKEAEKLTNEELGGTIYFKIEPDQGKDLRAFKL